MLLKLAVLLSAISTISPEIVEIECFLSGTECRVEELHAELPANATWKFLCPQNCTRIRMENVNLPRFPRELWLTHQQVTYLQLDGTDIEELAFGDFFNAAKLTEFLLRYQTKSLSLRDNCFWGAFELIRLDFYSGKINEIENGAFNGLPLLERLELENNEISYISNENFRNLPNLNALYLYSNTIKTIESEAFLYNPNLEYLNIHSNNLTEVDLLLPFIHTEAIAINRNQLTKLSYRMTSSNFEEFDYGIDLYMQENNLTQVYIQPNFAVEQLILWGNPIERIDTLPELRGLRVLNLQFCEIKSLDGQQFADKYAKLERLYISGNKITSISNETFAGLDKLKILELDSNELTEVDFPRLESLTSLDVQNNMLKEFPYGEDIRDTFPALRILYISNNDFDAEGLAELVNTLENQGIEVRLN